MNFNVRPPATGLAASLQQRIDGKTKPPGALGRLEALAMQLGLVQGRLDPVIEQPCAVVFAADHGAAKAGVSPFPQEVTTQMVANFLSGGAAINVFCRQMGLDFCVVDAGLKTPLASADSSGLPYWQGRLYVAPVAAGTASYLDSAAMNERQAQLAIETGRKLIHELADKGSTVVVLGEMGIGNTASASLLTHCLTDAALAEVTGRGAGHDDAGLAHKQALLEQALARGGRVREPLAALCEYGGFEIAMLAGAIIGAAERHVLVVIDGFIVTAALLVAHGLAADVLPYCAFGHCSDETGHRVQLAHLGVEPLLALDLRLGEGSGAALAFALVQAAAGFVNEMASFEDAGVSGRSD